MSEIFEVRVSGEAMRFCAAHFISYGDGRLEPLHGHNYRMSVTLTGPLDENELVYDFVALREHVGRLAEALDHRTLLPGSSPHLEVERTDGAVVARERGGGARYRFPERSVVVLPVPNTTAERVAAWLAERLEDELGEEGTAGLETMTVRVEETPGQSASITRSFGARDERT